MSYNSSGTDKYHHDHRMDQNRNDSKQTPSPFGDMTAAQLCAGMLQSQHTRETEFNVRSTRMSDGSFNVVPTCTVRAKAGEGLHIIEERAECIRHQLLSDGRPAYECYRTIRQGDEAVTEMVLDEQCMKEGATWFACATHTPTPS